MSVQMCEVCNCCEGGLVSADIPRRPWPKPDLCPECAAAGKTAPEERIVPDTDKPLTLEEAAAWWEKYTRPAPPDVPLTCDVDEDVLF